MSNSYDYDLLQLVDVGYLSNNTKDPFNIDLYTFFPDSKTLYEASLDELAIILLQELNKIGQTPCRYGLPGNERLSISLIKYYAPFFQRNQRHYPANKLLEEGITERISQVWQYLRNHDYILTASNCASDIVLTTEGKNLAAQANPSTYLEHNKYPWKTLHPNINIKTIQASFRTGDKGYLDAIRASFVEVETYIKASFNTENDNSGKHLSGIKLINQVFNNDKEKLRGLFASAFTLYRNEAVHPNHENDIIITSREAWHIITLASLLLYEIERLKS